MFGKFEKISFCTNKTIVVLHLAIMTIVFVMQKMLYSELFEMILVREEKDVEYIIAYVFKYNMGWTLILILLVAVVIYGYSFFIHKRKYLMIILHEQGLSKCRILTYLVAECCSMLLVPLLIGELLCYILL